MEIDNEACERLLVLASLCNIDVKKDIDDIVRLSAAYNLIESYPEALKFIKCVSKEPNISVFHSSVDSLRDLKEYIERKNIKDELQKFIQNPCIEQLINKYNFKFFYKNRFEGNFIYFQFDYLTLDEVNMSIIGRRVEVAGGKSRFWYEVSCEIDGKKYKEKLNKIEMSKKDWKLPDGFPKEWKEINKRPWTINFSEHIQCCISAWYLIKSFDKDC